MRMKRGTIVLGLVTSLVLILLSFITLNLPCKNTFPFPNFCFSSVIFLIINFPSLIIISLITSANIISQESSILLRYIAILINIPVYFLYGLILKRIFKR